MKHSIQIAPDDNGVIREWHLLEQRAPSGRLAASIVPLDPNDDRTIKAILISGARANIRAMIQEEGVQRDFSYVGLGRMPERCYGLARDTGFLERAAKRRQEGE